MEINHIVRLLEKTFDKQPWYGSSIMEILSSIDPGIVVRKNGNAHTILELVRHMISWRTFVTRRLEGDNSFEVSEAFNFPTGGVWEQALVELQASQQVLVHAVKKFPEDRLGELVPSNNHKYTYYTLLHGIIQHDVYHLGQIALLKKIFQ